MQIRQAIRLDKTDVANPRHMAEALNLVGGTSGNGGSENPALKPFRVISANDFTMDDVRDAIAYLEGRRAELNENANAILAHPSETEFDQRRVLVMVEGIRASADHALRLARKFEDDLRDDLSAAS